MKIINKNERDGFRSMIASSQFSNLQLAIWQLGKKAKRQLTTWQFGSIAINAEITFNFGNFQNW
jgi:hypothetical protein